MIYITGDTHGAFDRVIEFCKAAKTTVDDTLVILGDVGINYYGDGRDKLNKTRLARLPITLFCIKGNHENYAGNIESYSLKDYKGGKVWVQEKYPNILFAKDGEIYNFDIAGKMQSVIAIGGAYSIDKYYRLMKGYKWFEDEQPSDEIKQYVTEQLEGVVWKVDYVLSHTCPLRYEPIEWFLKGIPQDEVDKSTEEWLDTIFSRLTFNKWYCGHYHGEKIIDKMRFLFNSIEEMK